MSTRSKQIGTTFETSMRNHLREKYGEKVRRLTLNGSADQGDLIVEDPDGLYLVIECKAEKSINLAGYVTEALKERDHYANAEGLDPARGVPLVIVKRRNKSLDDAYVVTTVAEYFRRE